MRDPAFEPIRQPRGLRSPMRYQNGAGYLLDTVLLGPLAALGGLDAWVPLASAAR